MCACVCVCVPVYTYRCVVLALALTYLTLLSYLRTLSCALYSCFLSLFVLLAFSFFTDTGGGKREEKVESLREREAEASSFKGRGWGHTGEKEQEILLSAAKQRFPGRGVTVLVCVGESSNCVCYCTSVCIMHVCAYAYAYAFACVRACVRACVQVCVHA